MRSRLIPLDGSPAIEITKDVTVVGRREECDLLLPHKSISKMHCVIVKTDGLLFLRDLGSTNGTRVNGQRVRRAALLPNDQLAIAAQKFRVFLGPEEALDHDDSDAEPIEPQGVGNLSSKADRAVSERDPSGLPALPNRPNLLADR